MEMAQLRQFLVLAETLHFGRAARAIGMAQPHLSRAISRLEAEIGVPLFARTSRRVSLTAAGESFYEEAVSILAAEQRAKTVARNAMAVARRRLKVAFVSAALYRLLPATIRVLKSNSAPVTFELREATTNEQLALISAGEVALGLGHPPVEIHARLVSEIVSVDRFDAIVPVDHRLAAAASVTFGELAAEPWVLFPEEQGPALYAAIRDGCRVAGHPLNVVATAARLHSQLSLVAAGLGIGLAPAQSRGLVLDGTIRLPIRPYPASLDTHLAMLWDPRCREPALLEVLDAFRSIARGF